MEIKELHSIVTEFFGYKATLSFVNGEEKTLTCILYESFIFECDMNGRYGTFQGGIRLTPDIINTTFVGRSLKHNSDKASLISNLEIVDDFCRMRLPEKYLKALEENNEG